MSNRQTIHTDQAPGAIGVYSQAVKAGTTVYISGQLPLVPDTMTLENGDFKVQTCRCFDNLQAIAEAAGGSLRNVIKVTLLLTDLDCLAQVNAVMAEYFEAPYPARTVIGINTLPMGAPIEVEAILELK